MTDPIKYPLFDVSIMSIIRSHTYKIPNIIPTLTGYELCKGGNINGGWKVVQRNPSCPKMGIGLKSSRWRLDLGVPPPRKSEPYTHFLGNYGSCDVTY